MIQKIDRNGIEIRTIDFGKVTRELTKHFSDKEMNIIYQTLALYS